MLRYAAALIHIEERHTSMSSYVDHIAIRSCLFTEFMLRARLHCLRHYAIDIDIIYYFHY